MFKSLLLRRFFAVLLSLSFLGNAFAGTAGQMLLAYYGGPSQIYVDDVFSAYTWTGNATGSRSQVNGINLSANGGLVWTKDRGAALVHTLMDSARGVTNVLNTALTDAQYSSGSSYVTSFNTDGFSYGAGDSGFNANTHTYVSWTFRKAPKFFDVVQFVAGTNPNRRVNHSLGIAPGMIIVKRLDSGSQWYVYHQSMGRSKEIRLNDTIAAVSQTNVWGTSDPTATDFGIDETYITANGATYIAYLFAHDTSSTGIVQAGSATTDGSGNTSVNLGWEPQYVLFKFNAISDDWYIRDTARGLTADLSTANALMADSASAEGGFGPQINITATGFNVHSAATSQPFIYLAIRRPNKPPTAGTQVYNAIARTGTGAAATVTGVGFAPDLVIGEGRTGQTGSFWYDRLRGTKVSLGSYSTGAEVSDALSLLSYDMDGMSVGTDANGYGVNYNTATYVEQFFRRAPGVFDEVSYVGTGGAKTESHNLGVAPEFVIVKKRSAISDWNCWHSGMTSIAYFMALDLTGAQSNAVSLWNGTLPTSSVFSIGTDSAVNQNASTYVAYLFATKPGISKVGSYTGNGTSQTLNAGFTSSARFVMIKRTDNTGDWFVWDSTRGITGSGSNDPHLNLNTTAAEVNTTDDINPDSSGFIVNQNATTNINVNGATYIYLSFQ